MKRSKFKLALLISLSIFFGGFTSIYLYNNINLLKDHVVEDLESFSEELKISAWNWTTIEVVSTESTDNSFFPSIAVDRSGNVHIAWYDYTNYGGSGKDVDIFYRRWDATTAAWTTIEVVSTESTGGSWYPTIAVDGSGNVHIAWWDDYTDYGGSGTDGDIFYKRWNATTAVWTTTEVVSTESTSSSWYPIIAVDGSGNVHIAWKDSTNYSGSGIDRDIFYKRWNATTAVWTTTEVVSTESTDNCCYPTIAADGSGNVHIAWYDEPYYPPPVHLHIEWDDEPYYPYYGGSGNVHIAWWDWMDYDSSGGDYDIFYKRWNAITAVWTTTEVVSTETTGPEGPTIAVDGSGNVHIAWYEYTNYGGSGKDWDIFYKRWNAITAIWTMTDVVSTESTGDSILPTIAADGSGNVHLVWWDGTNRSGSLVVWDLFYKRWNAITATWTTTEVVSTESTGSDPFRPTIAVDGSGNVHIAWDSRPYYGGPGIDYDIFYKKLISPPLNPSVIIPGYPAGWIIISLFAGIGVIAILNKSKRIKLRN